MWQIFEDACVETRWSLRGIRHTCIDSSFMVKGTLLDSVNLCCPRTPGSRSEQWHDRGRDNSVGVFDEPSVATHSQLHLLWYSMWPCSCKLGYSINGCCSSCWGTFYPVLLSAVRLLQPLLDQRTAHHEAARPYPLPGPGSGIGSVVSIPLLNLKGQHL